MSKISIIIPVYNVEKYVSDCIETIVNQTYKNLEIILIDDGSTDACPEICDGYALEDSRITVIHKKNGGLSDARNAGLKIATGDFIAFVDSDDIISLNFCEKLLYVALDYKADIVECGSFKFRDQAEFQNLAFERKIEEFDAETAIRFLMNDQLKQVVWNKLYKKEVVVKMFFEKGKIHEDEYWTYKIFGRAEKIIKIHDILYFYRQQTESIMAQEYSLKRLYGMEAREERIWYVSQNFPELTHLAVQTYWHSAFNNYQAIARNSHIDSDFKIRNQILLKVEQNVKAQYYGDWKFKDRLWLKFFLAVPEFCSRLRNFINIGV